MSVEILTVSLSDESIARLAAAVVAAMGATAPPVDFTPPPADAAQAPQPDPWAGTNTQPAPQPPVAQPPAQAPAQAPQGTAPSCAHGPMRFVPSGFSRSTNKAYAAFYGCPAPRGPGQCKSAPA